MGQDDIKTLIMSLTAIQVRRFRRTYRQGSKRLALFDTIRDNPHLSIKVIRDRLTDLFPTKNDFRVNKSELYYDILAKVSGNNDPGSVLHDQQQQVRFLLGKDLFRQAAYLLERTMTYAEELEAFDTIADLLELEREIMENIQRPDEHLTYLEAAQVKRQEYADKAARIVEYSSLYAKAHLAVELPREKRAEVIDHLEQTPLLRSWDNADSTRAKLLFLRTHIQLKWARDKHDQVNAHFVDMVELLESHPTLVRDPQLCLIYIKSVFLLGSGAVIVGDLDMARSQISKLVTLQKTLKGENLHQISIRQRIWMLRIYVADRATDLKAGLAAIREIEAGLDEIGEHLERQLQIDLFYAVAGFLLHLDEHAKAIGWINRVRNQPDLHYRRDLIGFGWLLFLLAKYERDDLDLVKHQIGPTRNFLQKHDLTGPFENLYLEMFDTLVDAPPDRRRETLEKFRASFTDLKKKVPGKFQYFEILVWIEARIRAVPMAGLLREQYCKRD